MQPLIQQLNSVRSRARLMLIVMRLSAWTAVVVLAAVALAVIDYFLRLPDGLRFLIVLLGLGYAFYDIARRMMRSWSVRPALTTLALRLERMYPETAGRIASAVAFATEPHPETDSPLSRQLADSATMTATGVLEPRQIRRLIEPAYLLRALLALFFAIGVLVTATAAAPEHAATALSRWANPFGGAAWPNRYRVDSLTDQTVAPNNAPLRVAAQVSKGDHPDLRTWVVYKFVKPDQDAAKVPWQRALMTRQVDSGLEGEYRRPIEPMPSADRVLMYFEAGDDATRPQAVQLIQPPVVRRAVAQIDPPSYASKQIAVQRHDLIQPPRPSVVLDALAGSRVRLQMVIEGAMQKLPTSADAEQLHQWVARNFPGLISGEADADDLLNMTYVVDPEAAAYGFELAFTLKRPAQFRFNLTDAYGSSYEDQRLFRFEVRADRKPRAAVVEPAADQSVLATALIDLAAEAQDDVAVDTARLETRHAEADPAVLADQQSTEPRVRLDAKLDLSKLELQSGDEVAVFAIAQDNYRLDGERHEPVESTPRRLLIISEDEMTRQIRMDLADVRQRAIRARTQQQRLIESENVSQTARQQRDLVERVQTLNRSIAELRDRMARNRMQQQSLDQVTREAEQMLKDTAKSADEAASNLERAARDPEGEQPQTAEQLTQGKAQQQRTSDQLEKLVELLDQGRDMYELKQKLSKLQADQAAVSKDVREMLPRTVGKTADQLSEAERQQLQQMRNQQQELSDQAQQLIERMRSAAAAISRQSEKPEDQANAEALRQAADTATRQQLDKDMQEAAEQTGENQLSQAQSRQQSAEGTISQMLQDMGRAEQLRQQILQRRLMELVESIRKLRDQQSAQLDRLIAAQVLADLDGPLLTLRRNTMAVTETARQTDEQALAEVVKLLEGAAGDQASAIETLRAAEPVKEDAHDAEAAALAKLEQALKLAQAQAAKAQQEMTEQERDKLIKQYKALLAEQEAIRTQTQPLADKPADQRGRRDRAASIELGNRQADLRVEIANMREKIAQTIVYKSVHDSIDRWAGNASTRLRRAEPGAVVVMQQKMIESSLAALIEALKPPDVDPEFAEQPAGGGGGQGQQGEQPLIPDIAEVMLLRQRQVQIHEMTRMVDQAGDRLPGDQRGEMVDTLTEQQDDLAQTGQQLIESLSGGQPQTPQIPLPPGGDGDAPQPDTPGPEEGMPQP